MRQMRKQLAIITCLMAASLLLGTACRQPIALDGVEVREYQGKRLDSVNDFRENSIRGPQQVDIQTYRLEIGGLVASPQSYTYDQVVRQNQPYKKVLTLNCVEGWSATVLWEGILVKDLLEKAGPLPAASVVIFHAADGYTSSLPIEYLVNNNIMLAYRMNDVTLPVERGYPFQLVAESKWGYKWVRWVVKLELSDDAKYRGFWESRGYSNSGDLDKVFLDFEPFMQ